MAVGQPPAGSDRPGRARRQPRQRGTGLRRGSGWTGREGPTRIWKGEVSQVFSSSLFMTASYSSVSSGFSLLPQGGTSYNALFIDENGVFQGSYLAYQTVRPQHQVNATGSTFFSTGSAG